MALYDRRSGGTYVLSPFVAEVLKLYCEKAWTRDAMAAHLQAIAEEDADSVAKAFDEALAFLERESLIAPCS